MKKKTFINVTKLFIIVVCVLLCISWVKPWRILFVTWHLSGLIADAFQEYEEFIGLAPDHISPQYE